MGGLARRGAAEHPYAARARRSGRLDAHCDVVGAECRSRAVGASNQAATNAPLARRAFRAPRRSPAVLARERAAPDTGIWAEGCRAVFRSPAAESDCWWARREHDVWRLPARAKQETGEPPAKA